MSEGRPVVIVADDDVTLRRTTAELLEDAGYETREAANGLEVLALCEKARPDLIALDIMMPKMDGYEATRQIRALPDAAKADIPIFAMTANAFEEDRQNALKAGMNGHIAKPISTEVILEKLSLIEHDCACFKADCKNIQTEQ